MKWFFLSVVFTLGLCGAAIHFDRRIYLATRDTRISVGDPRQVALRSAPIPPAWILEGHPDAKAGVIGSTSDGTTQLLVWRVSAGRFNWFYDVDETVTILDGDVELSDGANAPAHDPKARHLGAGDVVFFRAGSTATWEVHDHVRKVATVRHSLPEPVASLQRWGHSVRTLFGMEVTTLF